MNKRRTLLIALGAAPLATPAVFPQAKTPVLIGWIHFGSRESFSHHLAAFKKGLTAMGYSEGQRFVIEERWANNRPERLSTVATELAARKPAVIVAIFSNAAGAAAKAAPSTPIVVSGGDLVRLGYAKTLARPGGMITGINNPVEELREKYLELLVDAVPTVRRIGVLSARSTSASSPLKGSIEAVRRSAVRRSIEVRFEELSSPDEIEPALSRLVNWGAQGLVVFYGSVVTAEASRIAALALAHRLPLAGPGILTDGESGALLGYGADSSAMLQRLAYYVDRILKGTKPGDLPIEQPMTFELVVNLKTAKVLGLTMPPEIMVRATRVIQ